MNNIREMLLRIKWDPTFEMSEEYSCSWKILFNPAGSRTKNEFENACIEFRRKAKFHSEIF